MTLLIACICIYGFNLGPGWYFAAAAIWFVKKLVEK